MSILVVGGAGYIGSHCVKKLIEIGYDVCVVDNLSTGHQNAIDKKARFYPVDIRNQEALKTVFKQEKIEAVIHFAANSLVAESMKNPLKYFNNNVHGTEVLLETMIEHNVKKIVFSSSAAVYGIPKSIPIKEEDATNPINTYGETKLMMEKMMKWCDQAYGLKYIALRYFNVGGANESGTIGEDHNPETHLIPIVIQTAMGKRDILTIYGDDYDTPDGSNIRDYVHMDDLIDAHILSLKRLLAGNDSDIFNLGSEKGYSNFEIVAAVRQVTGKNISLIVGARRGGDPDVLIASSEKAKKILGWNPAHNDIKMIISSAWKWHTNNPKGYKKQN